MIPQGALDANERRMRSQLNDYLKLVDMNREMDNIILFLENKCCCHNCDACNWFYCPVESGKLVKDCIEGEMSK